MYWLLSLTKLNDVLFRNSSFPNIFESQLLKYFLYLNLVIVLKEAFFSIFVKRKMDFRRINRRSGEFRTLARIFSAELPFCVFTW